MRKLIDISGTSKHTLLAVVNYGFKSNEQEDVFKDVRKKTSEDIELETIEFVPATEKLYAFQLDKIQKEILDLREHYTDNGATDEELQYEENRRRGY